MGSGRERVSLVLQQRNASRSLQMDWRDSFGKHHVCTRYGRSAVSWSDVTVELNLFMTGGHRQLRDPRQVYKLAHLFRFPEVAITEAYCFVV